MWRLPRLQAFVPHVRAWVPALRGYVLASAEPTQLSRQRARQLAWAVGLTAAILYALTAHWGAGGRVNPGDSAKFQYLPIVNGTPHSTGYPTYLLLSKVFYWALPFLTVSARITLLSVVCAAAAVSLLFRLSHTCTGSISGSIAAAALFGTSLTFWLTATDAEVYALHVLFYVSVSWCLVLALNGERGGRPLYLGLLLYALSFGNHLTSIALLPAVVWTALRVEGKTLWRPRNVGLIVSFVLLGISQYAYIYYLSHRGGGKELEYVGTNTSWSHLFEFMTGQQFKSRFFAFSLRELLTERVAAFLGAARRELSSAGLALATVGFVGAALRPTARRFLPIVLLALAGQLFVALNYRVEAGLYFVPVHLLLALMAAQGIAHLNRPRLVVPVALSMAGLNVYLNSTSGPLSLPATPFLAQVRWQSAQALGCKQILAAPNHYFISRIRNYFRHSEEYPGAVPYGDLKEIKSIDGLCVDRAWREKLGALGGFYLPAQRDSLASFFQRNGAGTLLVAFWLDDELDGEAARAFTSIGAKMAGLGPKGAYVAVLHDGHVLAEAMNPAGPARLVLPAGQALDGFTPRQPLELQAASKAFGNHTSIKIAGREQSSPRMNFRLIALDPEQNVVGDASTQAKRLANFNLFYQARPLSDVSGMNAVARVVQASGVTGALDRLTDGVLPNPGSPWDCRECVKLDGQDIELVVELPPEAQTGLSLFADNNDSFAVRCASDQRLLGSIGKVREKGMRARTLAFTRPCAKVVVALANGDGRASIGEIEGWRPEAAP